MNFRRSGFASNRYNRPVDADHHQPHAEHGEHDPSAGIVVRRWGREGGRDGDTSVECRHAYIEPLS
jgi:hypothetical protein